MVTEVGCCAAAGSALGAASPKTISNALFNSIFGSLTRSSAALIDEVGDQFQMLRVAAQALVAQVVYLLFAWDVPEIVGVGNEVYGDCLTIKRHAPIATASAST